MEYQFPANIEKIFVTEENMKNLILIFNLILVISCNRTKSNEVITIKQCQKRIVTITYDEDKDYDLILLKSNCDTISKIQLRDSIEFKEFKYRNGRLYYLSEKTGYGSINQELVINQNNIIDSIQSDYIKINKIKDEIFINRISKFKYDSIMIFPISKKLKRDFLFNKEKYIIAKNVKNKVHFKPLSDVSEYLVVSYSLLTKYNISYRCYHIKLDGPISESKFWSEKWFSL